MQKKKQILEDLNLTIDTIDSSTLNSSGTVMQPPRKDTETESSKKKVANIQRTVYNSHTKVLIESDSLLFMGVQKEALYILNETEIRGSVPLHDIYLVLQKVRGNTCNNILAYEFSKFSPTISQCLTSTCDELLSYFKAFITWPPKNIIKENLQIQFRYHFNKVQSIINCFEIKIEKPSNAQHEALTWSKYKKSNTAKYLISITPHGVVNYI